jgi:hypothetical protein
MKKPTLSVKDLLAVFDKDASQQKLNSSVFRKQWRKWFKNLFAHILKAHFPTVETEKTVQFLDAFCHGKDAELPLAHVARIVGHLCAICDYYAGKQSSLSQEERIKIAQLREQNPNSKTTAINEQLTNGLGFQEMAEFQKEFGFAYGETFTPLGELKGFTEATPIYFQTLIWSMIWVATSFPRTKKEAFRWIILQRERPLY